MAMKDGLCSSLAMMISIHTSFVNQMLDPPGQKYLKHIVHLNFLVLSDVYVLYMFHS